MNGQLKKFNFRVNEWLTVSIWAENESHAATKFIRMGGSSSARSLGRSK